MATVTKGRTFVSGEVITPTKLNALVDSATVTGIVNADINSAAAIADTKLATISTAGKVANSATTATAANTANAIVARDASGNFSAATITANVTGSGNSTFAGNVGIGTSSPSAKLATYGAGQTSSAVSTTSNLGGAVYVQDSGGLPGNGGLILLGAQQGAFAAIKSLISDETNNTVGDLAFCTRNTVADSTLTERLRITATGTINTQGNPITNCKTTAKAWVNFNGTGTPSIRSSYNVSSVTKNGTGDYWVNFATPMADANYSVSGSAAFYDTTADYFAPTLSVRRPSFANPIRVEGVQVQTALTTGIRYDCGLVCVQISGN